MATLASSQPARAGDDTAAVDAMSYLINPASAETSSTAMMSIITRSSSDIWNRFSDPV